MLYPLTKTPAESRNYYVDFNDLMAEGVTVATVDSVGHTNITGGTADLALGSTGNTQTFGFVVISGGTDQEDYRVTMTVTDSVGNVLEGVGILKVRELLT